MAQTKNVMAFDLGASSGRGILGKYDGKKITLTEINRFPHNFSVLNGHAFWNILHLMDEMKKTIAICDEEILGAGFDTWGVDCGLIDRDGMLVGIPGSYRDEALDEKNMEKVLKKLGGKKEVFEKTGIASLAYNTLYKLCYMNEHMPSAMDQADKMLLMPNLIEYLFSGTIHTEYSIASTTQLYDMQAKQWSYDIIERAGLKKELFSKVDYAGLDLGNIKKDIARETKHDNIKIISVSGHDTACAVASVPAKEEEFTFLSSGTWSLLGVSSKTMLKGEDIIAADISNEGTADGGYRPTVNIIGLWIIQELKRNFERQGKNYTFVEMTEMASREKGLKSFIRPDDFMQPGDYTVKIREYCAKTGQIVPDSDGALVRCVLESLALKYKQVYNGFKNHITWEEKLYMVGGGTQNELLNQFTANALDIPVITGASEATAVGNIMCQLKTLGVYQKREEKNEILNNSFGSRTYLPKESEAWKEAYARFEKLYEIGGK